MSNVYDKCPYVTTQKVLQGKWAIVVLYHLSTGPSSVEVLWKFRHFKVTINYLILYNSFKPSILKAFLSKKYFKKFEKKFLNML